MGYPQGPSSGRKEKQSIIAVVRTRAFAGPLFSELENAGYWITIVGDAAAALKLVRLEKPNLVLVDLELAVDATDSARVPASASREVGRGGGASRSLGLWRRLRQECDAPVLVLAADLHPAEWFVELESGADDFALMSSSPIEILARIRGLLRWAKSRRADQQDVIRVDDLVLQPAFHQVKLAGRPVNMTRTELALLAMMASEPGRAFSRDELMGALKGNRGISKRTVDSHINNLRSKIESDPRHPQRVLTVFGVGYKLSDNAQE